MDRMIVYPGAIPLDTDLLNVQRGAMKAIGFLAQACLGTSIVVDGLACTPTVPASMTINIGPGSVTAPSQVDALAYGSLPSDSSNLVKMGINTATTPFTLTAPTVSGQSINYLIQASLAEQDAVPVVLPYYNASNPAQGFAGAGNSGNAQNTERLQTVGLQLKAGSAGNTGSQPTPSADPGSVPIALITVNYGQSFVGATSISIPANAPFLQTKLPQLDFRSSTTRNGWQRLPGGVILQWGNGVTQNGQLEQIPFPLVYPNTALSVHVNEGSASGWNNASASYPIPTLYGVNNLSASGFQLSCCALNLNGANSSISYAKGAGYTWTAIGY